MDQVGDVLRLCLYMFLYGRPSLIFLIVFIKSDTIVTTDAVIIDTKYNNDCDCGGNGVILLLVVIIVFNKNNSTFE